MQVLETILKVFALVAAWFTGGGGAMLQALALLLSGLFFTLFILIALSAARDAFALERELWEATRTGRIEAMFDHLEFATVRSRRAWLVALLLGVGLAVLNSVSDLVPAYVLVGVAAASAIVMAALAFELKVTLDLVTKWRTNLRRVKIERGRQLDQEKRRAAEAAISDVLTRAKNGPTPTRSAVSQ